MCMCVCDLPLCWGWSAADLRAVVLVVAVRGSVVVMRAGWVPEHVTLVCWAA